MSNIQKWQNCLILHKYNKIKATNNLINTLNNNIKQINKIKNKTKIQKQYIKEARQAIKYHLIDNFKTFKNLYNY